VKTERLNSLPEDRQKLATRIWHSFTRRRQGPVDYAASFLKSLRYGDAIFTAIWIAGLVNWHVLVIYCFFTSQMLARGLRPSFVEGRHGAPILYWIYMVAMTLVTIGLDLFAFLGFWRRKR
jgi:hypothetical protein